MLNFLYAEINFFALGILILIIVSTRRINSSYFLGQKLYLFLLLSNILILVFDTLMWNTNGISGFGFRNFNIASTLLYYILSPVITMIWSLYADYQINRDDKRVKKLLIAFSGVIILNAVLSVLSLYYNVLFTIDKNNVYSRGKYFLVMAFICYFFLVYSGIYLIINKNKISKASYFPLFVFPIIPIVAGIIQVMVFGVSIIWVSMTLSLLVIYISTQNEQIYTDSLTGLYNRRQFDVYIEDRFRNNFGGKKIAGIMIDVDDFKSINDKYGHIVGDHAIEDTADILKKSIRHKDFLARFGGDEFVIILENIDESFLQKTVNLIEENVQAFNKDSQSPYTISLSFGYDFTDYMAEQKAEDFIMKIDKQMYEAKAKKRH